MQRHRAVTEADCSKVGPGQLHNRVPLFRLSYLQLRRQASVGTMKALIASPHALLEPRVAKPAQRGSVPDGLHRAAQRATFSLKLKVLKSLSCSVLCWAPHTDNVVAGEKL